MTIMQSILVLSLTAVPLKNIRTVIDVRYVEDIRYDDNVRLDYDVRLVDGSRNAYYAHRAVHLWDVLLTHDLPSSNDVHYIRDA